MFGALRDCVPVLKWCKHLETPETLLAIFEREVDAAMKEKILNPLCLTVENDLRLSSHLHLKQDDRNPFKVSPAPCVGWLPSLQPWSQPAVCWGGSLLSMIRQYMSTLELYNAVVCMGRFVCLLC